MFTVLEQFGWPAGATALVLPPDGDEKHQRCIETREIVAG